MFFRKKYNTDPKSRNKRLANIASQTVQTYVDISVGDGRKIASRSLLSDDMKGLLVYVPNPGADHYASRIRKQLPNQFRCLDLGCGNGPHRGLLERLGGSWTGCDFDASVDPATLARKDTPLDGEVVGYDGKVLPFPDGTFDLVWSWQALEHVHEPETTTAEVSRCLVAGGAFVGSTSFLEPYHAQSTYSYTPYGFRLLCERHGLEVVEIAPGLDGFAYLYKKLAIVLRVTDDPRALQTELEQARPTEAIHAALKAEGREDELVEVLAQICGTFRFLCRKSR